MTRYWTCHWQFALWRTEINSEFEPIWYAGSNRFRERGVEVGDRVFIVSLSGGQLYLGGAMTVKRILSRSQAVKVTDKPNLYNATEWIIGDPKGGTPLHLHRRLDAAVTRRVRFVSPKGEIKEPFFRSDTELDVQATRGVRQITKETAQLFERVVSTNAQHSRSANVFTVGEASIADLQADQSSILSLPGELDSVDEFLEGSTTRILVNRYERDPSARRACLDHYGYACTACGFVFEERYGKIGAGFIHVHHTKPIATLGRRYKIDPVTDLIPLCPNCHAAAHLKDPPVSVERLREYWNRSRK